MESSGKWVLSRIAIRSFLGVGPAGMELDLSSPVVVLSGSNGSGKSTVVSAIEWALFGELEIQITPSKTRGPGTPLPPPDYKIVGVGRKTSTWKLLVHRGEPAAEVKLTFKKGDSTLVWTRRRDSRNPSPADDQVDCIEDGKKGCADAEMVFNITHDLYVRGVAPRQTAIRNLVHYEKTERNEALDSLFGIEKYNKLSVGFSKGVKDLNRRVKKLEGRFEELQERLNERARSVDSRLDERKMDSAHPPSHKSLLELLNIISQNLGEQPPSEELSLKQLQVFIKDLHDKAENLWVRQGPQVKLSLLGNLDSAIGSAGTSWRELVSRVQAAQKEEAEIVNELGAEEVLNKLLAEAEAGVKAAEELLASTDEKAGLLDRAQTWVEGHSHSPGFDCPVCRREVERDDLASAIELSLQGLRESGGEIDSLQKKVAEAREEEKAAKGKVTRYQKSLREIEIASGEALDAQEGLVDRIVELNSEWKAQPQITAEEEAVSRLLQEVSELPRDEKSAAVLDGLLEQLGEVVSVAAETSREELNKVDGESKSVRERIVSADQLVELLLEIKVRDRLLKAVRSSGVEDSIDALRKAGDIAGSLAEVAGSISESKAEEIIESLSGPLQEWFQRISCHPLLKSAQIRVKVSRGGGIRRNQYTIRAADASGKNPVTAGPNLSGGCEMVLAVAALCAIQEKASANHGLGLFILDEPIESLDPEHTQRMAKALALHAPGERTIITTSQPLFAEQIKEAAAEAKDRAEVITLADFQEGIGTSLTE